MESKITKRELLASVSIIAILLLIGVLISNKISEHQMDKNEIYNKAVKIKESGIFEYSMRTNVGNAFVNGELKAIDTVTYPEIDGKYMYVKKVKERYTMHTRTVTYTTGSGKNRITHTRTEHYWTWDKVGSEDKTCKELMFCGVTFPSVKINIPSLEYIGIIKESSHIRYKYYGTPTEFKGTIFTKLKDGTIPDNTNFYKDMSINETYECLKYGNRWWLIFFWGIWIVLIIACVMGFYYLDNNWLE